MSSTHSSNPLTGAPKSPIRLSDVLIILRQRWPIGAGVGLVLAVIAAVFQMNQTPIYQSNARLMVEINPEKMMQLQDVVQGDTSPMVYDTIINALLERMRSGSMAAVVLENMTDEQLDQLREYYPDAPTYITETGRELPMLSGQILGAVTASWNPGVQTIIISAKHPDPRIARIIAEAYTEALILMQNTRLEERTGDVLAFLEEQSAELQEKLEQGEIELQQFRSEQSLSSVEGSMELMVQNLAQLRGALTGKKVELIALENRIDKIDAAGGDMDALLEISYIAGRSRISAPLTALEEARTRREVLSETYGRRHPIMLENEAVIDTRRRALERAVSEIVAEIRQDFEVTQSGYDSLLKELRQTEAEALELDRMAIDYRVLERKLDVQKQIFDVVSQQFTTTDMASQFDMASISILDNAGLPGKPISPDPQKAFLLAGFLFAACFFGFPIALEMSDNRLKTFADIENFVGKPVYGDIKRFRKKDRKELFNAVLNNDEDLAESFRSIYSSLKLQSDCGPPYVLLVTSSVPAEGKTFIASNLAAVFSRHQMRVLLVDCDFRRPTLHRSFELKNDVGVIEWVESDAPLPVIDAISGDERLGISAVTENLHVLPSGGSTKDPTEIIGHARFNRLMSRLKEAYDVLIIDTPPCGLFPDAALAADFADQTLFVAKQKETTRQKVRFAVNRLERSNAPVGGVVLNQISGSAVATGYGYDGQNYSYAYGYERDQDKYRQYYAKRPD